MYQAIELQVNTSALPLVLLTKYQKQMLVIFDHLSQQQLTHLNNKVLQRIQRMLHQHLNARQFF